MPITIAAIIGTRPEVIKLAPVILAARARQKQFVVRVIRTGQHLELADDLMEEFGIRDDVNLNLMQPEQGLADMLAAAVRGLSAVLAREQPDWALVQGDTTTAFAGALAAFYNGVKVGHVEAGLRTGRRDTPFPEEANRSMIACLADLHFAPTEQARSNLLREGIADADIFMTGNTVVDALFRTLGFAAPGPTPPLLAMAPKYLLVTAHRRENHGAPLIAICDSVLALLDEHRDLSAWLPMHPSPHVRDVLARRLGKHPRIRLTEPLGHAEFIAAVNGAILVLTDSGGVQEECAALGKPVLVLRESTERPEAVAAGVAFLVGTSSRQIVEVASSLLNDAKMYQTVAHATDVFGTGSASEHILDAILAA